MACCTIYIALRDLKLDALYVVYPGERRYSLMFAGDTSTGVAVQAIPLTELAYIGADWN